MIMDHPHHEMDGNSISGHDMDMSVTATNDNTAARGLRSPTPQSAARPRTNFSLFGVASLGLILLLAPCSGHVTLNPNYGAFAGNYFLTNVKVPHGAPGLFTTRITMNVPNGVLSATPEAKPGWTISETARAIPPYVSHGSTVSTAPATLTWTAVCEGVGAPTSCTNYPADPIGLDNDHLLEFSVQLKLGCDFGYDALTGAATTDASIWMDEHTIWWGVDQYVSTQGTNDGNANANGEMISWTGTVSGSESWSQATPKPSPYTFVYSSAQCTDPDSTGTATTGQVGMRWGPEKAVVAPDENDAAVVNAGEVKSIVQEALLTYNEETDASVLKLWNKVDDLQHDYDEYKGEIKAAFTLAIFATVLGSLLFGGVLGIFAWRMAAPKKFTHALLPDYDGATTNPVGHAPQMEKRLDSKL